MRLSSFCPAKRALISTKAVCSFCSNSSLGGRSVQYSASMRNQNQLDIVSDLDAMSKMINAFQFIEMKPFTAKREEHLSDDDFRQPQSMLNAAPNRGDVLQE